MTTSENSNPAAAVPVSRWVVFLLITVVGCAVDLYTKFAVLAWRGMESEKPDYRIVENYVGIQVALNEGALFGMGKGYGMLFAGLSVLAIGGICYWLFYRKAARNWFLTVSLGSVAGGILGNLYDRLGFWSPPGKPGEFRDEVRDWILLRWGDPAYTWPNFNIADCLLVCGAAMLMIYALLAREPEEPAKGGKKDATPRAASKKGKQSRNPGYPVPEGKADSSKESADVRKSAHFTAKSSKTRKSA